MRFSSPLAPLPGAQPWLTALLLTSSLLAVAQAPTITGLSPARNAITAPRASNVALTFDQAIYPASAGTVRVFSQQRSGQLVRAGGGMVSVNGPNTITFDPATDFQPGETVYVTIPATVQGSGAVSPHVYQFTAAVGGTGIGTFGAPATNPEASIDSGSFGLALGDLDGDGDLDLLTTASANTVCIRHNDGTGAYSGTQSVGVGRNPYSLVIGDVDGDGDLDLLTTNYYISPATSISTVSIRLNDGTGAFSGTQDVRVGDHPVDVAVGDVDGDGDLDFVTASYSFIVNTVSVRLNDGTGIFSGTQEVSVGDHPISVALGDVDGDGDLDLLAANQYAGTVSVRLNNGTGTFSGTQSVRVGGPPWSVALGDVDGDGDLDLLATSSSSADSTVSVRLNGGTGTFRGTQEVRVSAYPTGVAVGDADGDGDLDLFCANSDDNSVSVRLNDGSGTFSGTQKVRVGRKTESLALGDVDGDGDLDFVAANVFANTASIRLNGGTGPLYMPPNISPAAFSVWPNPVPAGAAVRVTGSGAHQLLTLLDATGRRLVTLRSDATGAADLRAAALAPGLYLLRAADGRTVRLVVE